MKKIIGLTFLAAFLSGCAADMMETHGDHITLIKTANERRGKGGVVRYLNTGMDFAKKARRSDAEKKMKSFCSGDYRITAEGPRSKFGADMPIGKSVSIEFDEYWYIAFDCLVQPPALF